MKDLTLDFNEELDGVPEWFTYHYCALNLNETLPKYVSGALNVSELIEDDESYQDVKEEIQKISGFPNKNFVLLNLSLLNF